MHVRTIHLGRAVGCVPLPKSLPRIRRTLRAAARHSLSCSSLTERSICACYAGTPGINGATRNKVEKTSMFDNLPSLRNIREAGRCRAVDCETNYGKLSTKFTHDSALRPSHHNPAREAVSMSVVVKIVVPFWILIVIRHPIKGGPKFQQPPMREPG